MRAASAPRARGERRLLLLDRATGSVGDAQLDELPTLVRPGDLFVVNDAATLPASLPARAPSGAPMEVRLVRARDDGRRWQAVALGAGDWRTPTERRPAPEPLAAGARLEIAGLPATVTALSRTSVRLFELRFENEADEVWTAIYRRGRPIQYAHVPEPLALWSVQTAYAARPWAVEMPSAGRPLTWEILLALRRRGVGVATLTHAAGLASTGDAALDAALPWPERYEIPGRTAAAIIAARAAGRRVIAVGTTVVRALEASGGRAGAGVATLVLGPATPLRVASGLITGLHVPGESHFELLRAFAPAEQLERVLGAARAAGLSGHELGDACLIA